MLSIAWDPFDCLRGKNLPRQRIDGRESAAFYLLYVYLSLIATVNCKVPKMYYNNKITMKEYTQSNKLVNFISKYIF